MEGQPFPRGWGGAGADLFTSKLRPLPTQDTQKHLQVTRQQESYRLTKGQKPGRSGYSCSPPPNRWKEKLQGWEGRRLTGLPTPPKKSKQRVARKNPVFHKTAGKHYANVKLMGAVGEQARNKPNIKSQQ